MSDIQQFIHEYDMAVISSEVEKIASNFHKNFILSTPTELWHINNDEVFIANLAKSLGKYKCLGAKACKMQSSEITDLKSGHYMINVKWGLINADNNPFVEFDISYIIKKIDNAWKYIFVIDHNEPE